MNYSIPIKSEEDEAKSNWGCEGGKFKYGLERMLSSWNTYMPLYCYTN
jgi:hypothetical protein